MEKSQFQEKIREKAEKIKIVLTEEQINKFYLYMNLLIEWNKKMNLTAITDPEEIIIKHFIDSLTVGKYLENNSKVIDVGTGAGFPGIPLAICFEKINFTLADSLQKRILFLKEIKNKLDLKNVELIHGRAEDLGKGEKLREQYDFAVSRAVAPLNILLEYLIPFIKVNGYCICMKGSNGKNELEDAKSALKILKGKVEEQEEFELLDTKMNRIIFKIKKEEKTQEKYPRKAGMPSKQPL